MISSGRVSGGYPAHGSDLSTAGALMHLVRANLGIAVLSMPWAISHAGIVVGPILTSILVLISVISISGLVECARWHSRNLGLDHLDYGDVTYHSIHSSSYKIIRPLATVGRRVVNISIIALQFGACCVYYVAIAQDIRRIAIEYWPGMPEDRVIIAVLWVPLTITTCSRKLSGFHWISGIGNLLFLLCVALVLKYAWTHLPHITSFPIAKPVEELPIFLTIVPTVEGVCAILPLENSMKSKEQFFRVICITFASIAILIIVIGISGYLAFGSSLCANITLNLPLHDGYSKAAKVSLILVLLCTYPIHFHIMMGILWPMIEEKFQTNNIFAELGFKAALSALPCILSISLPFVDSMMALAGTFLSAPLQFIFPSVVILLTWSQQSERDARCGRYSVIQGERVDFDSAQFYLLSGKRGFNRFLRAGSVVIAVVLGAATVIFGLISTIGNIKRNYELSSASSTCRGGANFSGYHLPEVHNSTLHS